MLQVHITGMHISQARRFSHYCARAIVGQATRAKTVLYEKSVCKEWSESIPNKRLYRFCTVQASKHNRRLSYLQLSMMVNWEVSEYAVRNDLCREGLKRYISRAKPPISERSRVTRLTWALEHLS